MIEQELKAWAIVNWDESAIVNDGTGQKRIYRTKELAEEKAKDIGEGTSVKEITIKL